MQIDQIIDALGGSHALQTLLGVGPSAVSNYRGRGAFPEAAKIKIWQALKAKGIMVDPETLEFPNDGKAGGDSANPPPQTESPPAISGGVATPRILLIITGGIAAYKALEAVRGMRRRGWQVRAILTKGGAAFITPLSVSALTGRTTYTDLFSLTDETEMGHIRLARDADVIIVAPATADFIAKIARGAADDLASTAILAAAACVPVLIAPAMNPFMWANPATVANCALLKSRGMAFIGPDSGEMACGEEGPGRLAETDAILDAAAGLLPPPVAITQAPASPLSGKRVLVTSGPTHEPIDAVRYIANRSSGKQGHAIAEALADRGAMVTLISGPVAEPFTPRHGVHVIGVETAEEMCAAAIAALPCDIAICAAAVADWRVESATGKIKKVAGAPPPVMAFTENPDILATISRHKTRPGLVVGFAAETQNVVQAAKAKRIAKGCDWIVANDVGGDAVFGKDENEVVFITGAGAEVWPRMQKSAVAMQLVDAIETYMEKEKTHGNR